MSIPRALLFDLDETLIDRRLSIGRYAERIVADFTSRLDSADAALIAELIRAVDGGGYRQRDEVFALLSTTIPWTSCVTPAELGAHWRKCFPFSSVISDGAIETLHALRSADIQIGIVTNGKVDMQTAKIEHIGVAPGYHMRALRALTGSGSNFVKDPNLIFIPFFAA